MSLKKFIKKTLSIVTASFAFCIISLAAEARNPDVSFWLTNISSGSLITDSDSSFVSPEIAVSGNTVHTVWAAYLNDGSYKRQLWYRRSLDGGKTWQNSILLVETSQNGLDANEAFKRLYVNGTTVHIAYASYLFPEGQTWSGNLYYARSTDNGATFEETRQLYTATACTITDSYIAGDEGDISIAIRLSSSSGYKRDSGETFNSSDDGQTFTHTQAYLYDHNDPSYAGSNVFDVLRQGDNVYVSYKLSNGRGCAYDGEAKEYLASSTDGGATFIQRLISEPNASGCYKSYSGQDTHYVSKIAAVGDAVHVISSWINADGVKNIYTRKSLNKGDVFLDPVRLFSEDAGLAFQSGQETLKAKGSYVYAMTTTTGGKILYQYSPSSGAAFEPTVEAASSGWFPLIALDPSVTDGSRAYLFWQGYLRKVENGSVISGVNLLFPFFRTSFLRREQMVIGPDGAANYVLGGLFYSSALCGGNCKEDIFFRSHSFTPDEPQTPMALRIRSEAISFESRYDNMQVPDAADFRPTGAFTVALWVKPAQGGADTGYTNVYRPVAFKPYALGFSYALGTIIAHESVSLATDRIMTAEITTSVGTYQVNPAYSDTGYVPYDSWSHLAMTYDPNGGANNLKAYLNGELIASATALGTILADGNPFQAGHYGNWDLDDLKIWGKALTGDEVRSSMKARCSSQSGLLACYGFDSTAKDMTDRGNNGIYMFKEEYVVSDRPNPAIIAPFTMLLGE